MKLQVYNPLDYQQLKTKPFTSKIEELKEEYLLNDTNQNSSSRRSLQIVTASNEKQKIQRKSSKASMFSTLDTKGEGFITGEELVSRAYEFRAHL